MTVRVEEALQLIYDNVAKNSLKIIPIEEALGCILAEEIVATHNLPPFDNSAMDGYALTLADAGKTLHVNETIFAGDNKDIKLSTGVAVKIMTGAKIPEGAECIVPVEDTQQSEDGITFPDNLQANKHIRFAGEDIQKGMPLLEIGERLEAHKITLLASQGISHVRVYKRPKVALFASGNELKMHFEKLENHQLYNTNTPTLLSRAQELGCDVEFIGTAKDTMEDIQAHIKSALECDLVVTSGGVSVGDADFTKEAFGAFGYEIFFEKVEIKPGKPTTFGRIGNTFVLNLPGNPLAAALNFELFGLPIVLALSGASQKYVNTLNAKMKEEYRLRSGRRVLVPGHYDGEFFTPCEHFAPGMISPLAYANGFIMIDESCDLLAKNAEVKFISTKFLFTSKKQKSLVSA